MTKTTRDTTHPVIPSPPSVIPAQAGIHFGQRIPEHEKGSPMLQQVHTSVWGRSSISLLQADLGCRCAHQ